MFVMTSRQDSRHVAAALNSLYILHIEEFTFSEVAESP